MPPNLTQVNWRPPINILAKEDKTKSDQASSPNYQFTEKPGLQ